MEKIKKNKGITLIALVITIIVLLILAGVSLSAVFSQDGIFSRAEKSVYKYNKAKAREILELTLGEAQMQKYEEGLTETQLDRKIQEIGELLPKEDPNPNIQDVIVEGYIFKIDKSVPKIIDFVDKADGIIITAVLSNNATDGWLSASESDVNIKGKIMTYSSGKITTVRAKSGETPISGFSINKDGLYEINHITESSIITIEAEDSKGKTKSKEINVEVKIDKTAPTVETVNVEVEGRKIKLSATGHDKDINGEEQSGIKEFNYTITPTDGVDKVSGTFSKNGTVEINVTNWSLYTIKVTATDKCLNTTETPKEQTADIRDVTAPTIETVNVEVEGLTIKLSATGHDRDATGQEGSGIANFSYTITPVDGLSKTSGIFGIGETAIITSSLEKTYTITVNAVDNASNPTTTGKQATATTVDGITIAQAREKINETNYPDYIGTKIIDYNPTGGGIWRVFYYDAETTSYPNGYFGDGDGNGPSKGTIYLKRDFEDNKIKIGTHGSYKASSEGIDLMNRMNKEWASNSTTNKIDLSNEYSASWLCDPEVWNEKYKTSEAKYAIGASSIEMWTKAYNAYLRKYEPSKVPSKLINCGIQNQYGYGLGLNNGSLEINQSIAIDTSIERSKVLAVAENYQGLASPSCGGNDDGYFGYHFCVVDTKSVEKDNFYWTYSFCPVVALNQIKN